MEDREGTVLLAKYISTALDVSKYRKIRKI